MTRPVMTVSVDAILFFIGIWFLHESQASSPTGSGLTATPKELDLGEVPVNDESPARAEFVLKNESDSDIDIRSFLLTCACTGLNLRPQMLAPGGEVRVRASMRLSPSESKTTVVIRIFWVKVGEDTLRQTAVRLTAKPKREFMVSQTELDFSDSEPSTKSITISRVAGQTPLQVEPVLSPHPAFQVSQRNVSVDEETIDIRFEPAQWLDSNHIVFMKITLASPPESFRIKLRPKKINTDKAMP